jgi:ferredoxin-NADP reductase
MSTLTTAPSAVTGRVDAALGRLPMYRVVTLLLALLAAYALLLIGTDRLLVGFTTVGDAALTLVVAVAAAVLSNAAIAWPLGVRPHTESSVITGLLLFFLLLPAADVEGLVWVAATAVAASASKYVIAVRGRHVVNPAAAGVVIVFTLHHFWGQGAGIANGWWIANEAMVVPVAVAALVVLWRTRKVALGLVFALLGSGLVVLGQVNLGSTVSDALTFAFVSSPAIFLAGFMLSEPLTLPPRRGQQLGVAVLAAVVYAWPSFQSIFVLDPPTYWFYTLKSELALVLSGAVAFWLGQRGGVRLHLTGRRRVAGDVWELSFAPRRPVRFAPGQYLELAAPHRGADRRGVRRAFSIVSPAGADEVAVALRVPEPCSSYKSALLATEVGSRLTATAVGGDFVLPRGDRPLVLVAGGIGVTPFLSQLRSPGATDRDVVLVYGVPDADDVAYRDELVATGVPVVLVAPGAPRDLPAGWRHVDAPYVTADLVAGAVPDLGERAAYVSGPPAMVAALRGGLRGRAAKVRTDAFAGY